MTTADAIAFLESVSPAALGDLDADTLDQLMRAIRSAAVAVAHEHTQRANAETLTGWLRRELQSEPPQ